MDASTKLVQTQELGAKVTALLKKRLDTAAADYSKRVRTAYDRFAAHRGAKGSGALDAWSDAGRYAIDFVQRSILFWDALRQRGNDYVARANQPAKPVMKYQYETIADARQFAKPVNYALVSIVPPAGVQVDAKKRPYVIIDPRAGHGPGIAGFKGDSQVAVALREGHPVYFVIFFPEDEPEQTLIGGC